MIVRECYTLIDICYPSLLLMTCNKQHSCFHRHCSVAPHYPDVIFIFKHLTRIFFIPKNLLVFILYNFVMENRSFLFSPQEQFTYSNTVNKSPPRLLFKLNSTNLFYLVIHINRVWIVIKTSIIMSPSISNPRKWSNLTCILKL